MRLCVVIAACFSISAAAAQDAGGAPFKLSSKQIEAVKAGVRRSLKDPDSARFDQPFIAARSQEGFVTVCGLLNSKNSYGGYVGNVPFTGMLMKGNTVFLPNSIDVTSSGQYATRAMCAQAGAALD